MLKKIPVADLRVGMYFVRVDGSWLDHSLWRGSFLVSDAVCLSEVASSGICDCWIDVRKGLDVALTEVGDAAGRPTPIAPSTPSPVSTSRPRSPARGTSFASDLPRAAQICKDARVAVEEVFSDIRGGRTPSLSAIRPVAEEIASTVFRRSGALLAMIRLKAKDDYTCMHSVSVCALMASLSRALGFDEERCAEAGLAGLLHDVGKAFIPLEILNKPGKLTEAEFALIKAHPAQGHALLRNCGLTKAVALDVCLHHHEKVDGSGYPDQLIGEGISQMARMGAVCDVYDAVTSARPYKAAWEPSSALCEMASWRGHFDRATLAAFVKMMGVFPVGSLVRLASGRLAVVLESRQEQLNLPLVKVFYSTRSNEPVTPQVLDLSLPNIADRIVSAESRDTWSFGHLDRLTVM